MSNAIYFAFHLSWNRFWFVFLRSIIYCLYLSHLKMIIAAKMYPEYQRLRPTLRDQETKFFLSSQLVFLKQMHSLLKQLGATKFVKNSWKYYKFSTGLVNFYMSIYDGCFMVYNVHPSSIDLSHCIKRMPLQFVLKLLTVVYYVSIIIIFFSQFLTFAII